MSDISKAAAAMGRAGRGESKRRGDSAHYSALRAKRATIYGYRNVAYHSGPTAEGYAVFFRNSVARDLEIAKLRSEAILNGLSYSAARAGIYEVKMNRRHLTDEQREELDAVAYFRTA